MLGAGAGAAGSGRGPSPTRRSSAKRSSVISLGNQPGASALTRMSLRDHWLASSRVRLSSPPFEAEYDASGTRPIPRERVDRDDVHDAARDRVLDHGARRVLGDRERCDEVQLHGGPEVVDRLVERAHRLAAAGVVHHDVDAAGGVDDPRDQLGARAGVGDVAVDDDRIGEPGRERVEPVAPTGGDGDARADRVEHGGEAGAESGAGAGDERDLAVESESGEWLHGGRP